MNKHFEPEVIDLVKKIIAISGDLKDSENAASLCAALTATGCMIYDSFGKDPAQFGRTVATLMPKASSAVTELKSNGVSI